MNNIRHLINLLESIELVESEGLTNRKPGTLFINAAGEKAFFKSIHFFPQEGGVFDADELQMQIQAVEQDLGQKIEWINAAPPVGGFGIAQLEREDGSLIVAGRFFRQIQLPYNKNKWKNNELPQGFALQTKGSKKESAGYGPSDVLENKLDELNTAEILKQVRLKFGEGHPLCIATELVAAGNKTFKIPGKDIQFEAFRDYFCEILHPIALASGAYTGNAGEAEKTFFKGSTFADAKLSFSSSKTNGLYDSLAEAGGGKIKISSKGNGGAAASVSNLSEAIEILAGTPAGAKMLKQYAEVVEIITTIRKQSGEEGPIIVSEMLGVIDKDEANSLRDLKQSKMTYVEFQKLLDSGKLPSWMTKNLKKIWDSVGVKVPEKATPFYKLLAGLAKVLGEHVNTKTNFAEAAASILNHSALVQVDTRARQLPNGDIEVTEFRTTYPSTVVSSVVMLPGDTYMSHKVHGRLSFKIYYGESKPTKSELAGTSSDAETSAPKAKLKAPGASMSADVVKRPGKTGTSGSSANLGRERR